MKSNQDLLCNFFRSATQFLAPKGEIRVALCFECASSLAGALCFSLVCVPALDSQPRLFRIMQQALEAFCVVRMSFPFVPQHYPGQFAGHDLT